MMIIKDRIMNMIAFVLLFVSQILYGQEPNVIINDDFANKPFGMALSIKNVNEVMPGKISIKKNPIKNKFTGAYDTLLIYKSIDGDLTFYKNSEKMFFYKATVNGKGIKLAESVKIGMSKNDFADTFGMKSSLKEDLVVIKNTTEYANHKFYFKNNNLIKIELNTGID